MERTHTHTTHNQWEHPLSSENGGSGGLRQGTLTEQPLTKALTGPAIANAVLKATHIHAHILPPSVPRTWISRLVGGWVLALSPFQWSRPASTASQPAVWRVHVRRIADASAHRPNRSMSRRASAFPAALHKLATVAGLCRLSERRSVHRRLLMQPAPAVAASDW